MQQKFRYLHEYIAFLLWPAFEMFRAVRFYRRPWAPNIVWLITIFYGFTFVITADSRSDSVHYANQLASMYASTLSIGTIFAQAFVVDGFTDLYVPLITFLVSRFTDNFNILFSVFGLIFGYFYSRNIWFLIEKTENKLNVYSIVLLILFASIVSIWEGINGARFWTAAHVFMYGFLRFLFEKKRQYLVATTLSLFFHFSFFVPILSVLLYWALGDRWKPFYIFFLVSFFVNELDFSLGENVNRFLPEFMHAKVDAYTGQRGEIYYLESQKRSAAWFLVLNEKLFSLTILAFTSYLAFQSKRLLSCSHIRSFFCAGMLLHGIFNIIGFFPTVDRFLTLSSMVLFCLYFFISQHYKLKHFNTLILLFLPALVLYITVKIRYSFQYTNYLVFIGNPLIASLVEVKHSFWEIINSI